MKSHLSRTILHIFTGILLSITSFLSLAGEKVVLTSLEWPPYTGAQLKGQGASVAVVKAAFAKEGYDLEVKFFPWQRAVYLAKEDAGYDGYFPEYYADSLKQDFILSDPIGSGPLGFAELKSKPIPWKTLNDLKPYKIGIVSGYVNTTEFDKMVADKTLKTSTVGSDEKNLQKLSAGRFPLAVVDKNVMNYILNTSPSLKASKDTIQFNQTLLEDKQLYIPFKKGARGEKLVKALNAGLKKIDIQKIMQAYF